MMLVVRHFFRTDLSYNKGNKCAQMVIPTYFFQSSYVMGTLEPAREPWGVNSIASLAFSSYD